MDSSENRNWLHQLSSWYFNRRVLPHWCVLLADTVIVFLSCIFIYWVSTRTAQTLRHLPEVCCTAAFYALLSWIGAFIFKTYSGILRYSGFVDLLKVLYASMITLALGVGGAYLAHHLDIAVLSALSSKEMVAVVALATLLMWAIRVLVKQLYEMTNKNNRALPVLIYGAMSGAVFIAKSIRVQQPARYVLRGFITHRTGIKNMRLMGVPVYPSDENLMGVIKKKNIQAVLVSPLRLDDFRQDQEIQDLLIGAGCKIFMGQEAKEASIRNGELSDEEMQNMQMREVSVEDLLPRQQIRVDMKSVGQQLRGKKVLITGSAGSIGAEMVRQVASFAPAKMMLIDQAETPQHDIRLMMATL